MRLRVFLVSLAVWSGVLLTAYLVLRSGTPWFEYSPPDVPLSEKLAGLLVSGLAFLIVLLGPPLIIARLWRRGD